MNQNINDQDVIVEAALKIIYSRFQELKERVSNKGIEGIVWGRSLVEAKEQLDRIRAGYEIRKIKETFCVRGNYIEESFFENGDHWMIVIARDSAKGRRCNISYISSEIDDELINNIIIPATTGLPFSAWRFY